MVERGSGEYAKDKTRGRARVEAEPEKDGGREEGGEDDRKTGGPKGSEEEVRGLVGKREETEMVGVYSSTRGCYLAPGPPSPPNTELRLQRIILYIKKENWLFHFHLNNEGVWVPEMGRRCTAPLPPPLLSPFPV